MCHSLMLYYLEFISKHHRSKISSGLYIYVSWITVHWKGRKLLFALLQLLLYLASKSQFLCNLEKKNNPSDSIHCLLKYIHVWFMMDASDETIRLSVSTAEKYLLTFSFILNLYRDFDPVHWLVSCFSFFFSPWSGDRRRRSKNWGKEWGKVSSRAVKKYANIPGDLKVLWKKSSVSRI